LVQPNAVAAALDPLRHMAGTGSSLLGVIQMLLGAVGGYAVNALYDGTPRPMGVMMLLAALCSGGIYAALLWRRPAAA
jgi:DHA1 family bicyclomycin/chloramphenicol resistance-like MFS transporter